MWEGKPFDIWKLWADNLEFLYGDFRTKLASICESVRLFDFIERIEVTIGEEKYDITSTSDINSLPSSLKER